MNRLLYARNTDIQAQKNIVFGESNDAPTGAIEHGVFVAVLLFLQCARMRSPVVALNGNVAGAAQESDINTEPPLPYREPILRGERDTEPAKLCFDELLGRRNMIELQDIPRGTECFEISEAERHAPRDDVSYRMRKRMYFFERTLQILIHRARMFALVGKELDAFPHFPPRYASVIFDTLPFRTHRQWLIERDVRESPFRQKRKRDTIPMFLEEKAQIILRLEYADKNRFSHSVIVPLRNDTARRIVVWNVL